MSRRWVVLVARPTPSGVDRRSFARLAAEVGAVVADPVRIAHLDQDEPSVHDVLDDAASVGVREVLAVPVAVPADPYLDSWLARAVANWHETRDADLDVRVCAGLSAASGVVAAVADLARSQGTAVTASPAAFRSPAWSEQPAHGRHVLVCRGPRCTAHGAGETHRAISRAARGTDALVTPVGCLGPCNLGPLVVTVPAGRWHAHVGAEFELAPPETLSVDDRRAPTGDHGEKVVRGDRQATTSP